MSFAIEIWDPMISFTIFRIEEKWTVKNIFNLREKNIISSKYDINKFDVIWNWSVERIVPFRDMSKFRNYTTMIRHV